MNNRFWIILLGCIGLILNEQQVFAQTMAVIGPDTPLPRVVAAEGEVHQSAAVDLCEYLSRVTNRPITVSSNAIDTPIADNQVTIHVGPDDFTLTHAPQVNQLYADGFILKSVTIENRHHLILSGFRRMSSRWAVEEFLKQYAGVRWLFPYPKYGEIVPSRSIITVETDLNQTHEPDYLSRANVQMYYFDSTHKYLRLRPHGYAFGQHALQTIFDAEDYKAHPEWFALFVARENDLRRFMPELIGTTKPRRWHWDYGNGWQICTTNLQTVEHAVAYARDYLDKNPDSPIVSIGANDGSGWCEGDTCAAFANSVNPPYSISERWWFWVNQVAKEVSKTHPNRWVEALAYSATSRPPRFKLEKNVAISFTTVVQSQLVIAEKWRDKCQSVNLYSYAYGSSFAGYRHYPHAMRDYLKWGHDTLGAMSHITEAGGDWSIDGPKYHYMQALQWDVNANPDQLMEDFCQTWFGSAAKPMKQFWDRLEQVYDRRKSKQRLTFYEWVAWRTDHNEFEHYTLKDVKLLDLYITQAQEQVDSEADRFRLSRVVDSWKWYQTILLSKLKYGDRQKEILKTIRYSPQRVMKLARELAELISQRDCYFHKVRTYPEINPRTALPYFWSLMSEISMFSDERMLLDALCDGVTKQHAQDAVIFWKQIAPDDPLYEAAQTQIYMIAHPTRSNVLRNGDFESGTLDGWKISGGQASIIKSQNNQRRNTYLAKLHDDGGKIVTLSQSVDVKPGQRYRLTASVRYATRPNRKAIAFDAVIRFFHQNKAINCEPTRSKLPTSFGSSGWGKLQTTVTVPPSADTATIMLRNNTKCQVHLDNISLELIQEGPNIEPGVLDEDFSQVYLDRNTWHKSTAMRSGLTPTMNDGKIVFGDQPMATLIGFADFNDLLRYEDDQRYRLQIHSSIVDAHGGSAIVDCGIQTGTGPISTKSSGTFWTYQFALPGNKPDTLNGYAFENKKRLQSAVYKITPSQMQDRDAWFTFYFDPQFIWVYLGRFGYDESDEALVGKFEHQMSNPTDLGSIYFKFTGKNCKIDEIRLMNSELTTTDDQLYDVPFGN